MPEPKTFVTEVPFGVIVNPPELQKLRPKPKWKRRNLTQAERHVLQNPSAVPVGSMFWGTANLDFLDRLEDWWEENRLEPYARAHYKAEMERLHPPEPSKREKLRLEREAKRVVSCVICGGSLEGMRSDARTDSDACRQELKRQREREAVTASAVGPLKKVEGARFALMPKRGGCVQNFSDADIRVRFESYLMAAWSQPLPRSIRFVRSEWKHYLLNQAFTLSAIAREELAKDRPDPATFALRCEAQLEHWREVAEEE